MTELYDLAIVGAGPGGLTAAIYAVRAGLKTDILEKAGVGGQIASSDVIENYPGFPSVSGAELMQKFEEHARGVGGEFRFSMVERVKKENGLFTLDAGEVKITAKSVIASSGAEPSKLGIPGEKEFIGRGVSNCATCDGPFYRGRDVAVIGGGDTAVKESIYLGKIAGKIYLVHRRDRLRAEKVLQERLFQRQNIEYCWNSRAVEIGGDASGVTHIVIADARDGSGTRKIKVHGAFIFVGIRPNTDFLECDKDPQGFIVTNGRMETSVPGLFAVGDCRATPLRQVSTAVGDGAVAGVGAEEYVSELEGRAYAGKK